MVVLMVVAMLMVVVALMVMAMLMLMMMFAALLFLTVDLDRNVRTGNAALDRRFCPELDTRDSERVELLHKRFTVVEQLKQCRSEHIAGSTHTAVYI